MSYSQLRLEQNDHVEELLTAKVQHAMEISEVHRGYATAIRDLEMLEVEVTYYCPCTNCTPGYGITASGVAPVAGRTLAADTSIFPIGTEVYIENVGWRVVEDTGSAIKGLRVDVYVDDHNEALQLGRHKAFLIVKRDTP